MNKISKDQVVSFRYIMRNEKREILAHSMEGVATTYLHGSNSIQAHLQEQLEGLKAGDSKIVHLSKFSKFADDNFTFEVIIDQVRIALAEELILGYPVQLDSKICGDDCDCHDAV